jgi:hypothetical protein
MKENITNVFWSLYLEQLFSRKKEKTPLLEKKPSVMRQHIMCFELNYPRENGNNFHLTLQN